MEASFHQIAPPSRALAASNRAWFRLGLLLSRIVSPVVVGAMFLLT